MQTNERVVIGLPLQGLPTESGDSSAIRVRDLTSEDIRRLLQSHPLRFVVADVGCPLKWHSAEQCYSTWKSEVIDHLVEPGARLDIESFPGGYAYSASEWILPDGSHVVVLEKHH